MRIRLNDLAPGVTYALRLRSNSGDAVSDWSRVFNITTSSDIVAPKVPTGLAVSFSGSTFIATWNAVTLSADNTPAHDLDHYEVKIESTGTATTQVYYSADTRFEFDLQKNIALFTAPRASITFSVRAVDKTGNASAYTSTVTATNPPPSNPTGFTADPVVDGISLKWNAVAENDVTGYKVYYGTTAGSQTTLVWTGNATAKTVANFAYSTDAYYRVVAVDVFSSESPSGPVVGPVRPKSTFATDSTAPAVPTGLAATLTNYADMSAASAAVSWTAVTDTDGDLAGYQIGYRPVGATDWEYTTADYTVTSTRIDRLLAVQNYEFRIRSFDWSYNMSAWSSTVTATATANTAPSTPTAPTASSGVQRIQVTIPGTKAAGGAMEGDVAFYEVYASTLTGFTPAAANQLGTIPVGPAMVESWQVPASGSGTTQTWYVKIIAVDRGGLKSAASAQTTATPNLILTANIGDAQITNAKINDLAVDKLTAGSGLVTSFTIKSTLTMGDASNDGVIQSYDYSTGVAGYRLNKNSLEINNGSIAASTLLLQNGHNMMPPQYADFEYGDFYYINSFWNPRGQGKLAIVGGGLANSNLQDSTLKAFTGTRYLGVSNLGATNALEGWFGTTTTDYNIKVDPGQTYIVSGYFKNWSTANTQWNLVVKGNDGSTIVTQPINLGGGTQQTTYTRVWATVTIPVGVTAVIVGVTNSDTTSGKDLHIDAMQFEPKLGALSTPSVWKPPAQTTISPSGITTGLLRSSNDIVVGGSTQPAWSINLAGNIQVGDALVRGKLIVGTGNETAPNRAPNNGDFETDVTGYSVYQSGATGTAIARTTTAGEVVMGTGAAKITAAAGTKTSLGIQFATPSAYPTGTTITISGYVRANAAGGSLYADALNASAVVVDTEVITAIPTANDAYYFSATFTLDVTSNVTTIALYQNNGATGITTTSIIFDTIVLTSSIDMGESFVASANFITGDAGQGWKIDGNGNVEFNSGYFRGQLGSGIVTADAIASDIVMSSTFRTGYSGQRVEFDSTGIVMYDTINQPIIQLPTDPSAKATFQGDLVASSMTVEDQLAIRGNGNEISKGSTVTLQSGTTAPSSPPTVTVDWKTISVTADAAFAPYRYGVTVQGGWFRVAQVIYGGGTVVDSYDLTTGAHQWGNLNTAANDGMWNALGGITSIGNNVYMLGTNKAGQWRLMGWTFGTGVTGTPTRLFNVSYPQSADHRIPALGNDGTNLIVALTNQTNLVQVRSFSATTGAQLTAALVSDLTMASDVAFVNKGAFDNGFGLTAGTPVYVVGLKNSATAYVLDQNFKRLAGGGYDFPLITKPAGQCFYNGKFYTFDAAGNRITEHTGATWNSGTAGMDKWWAANSWYNSTGPYETMIGPIAGFTMKKRARAVITSPPIPKALGVPEDVKAVGLYMARGNATPTRTLFQRQTYLADGVRTIKMQEELNSTMPAPGATNTDTASQPKASSNFPNTTPGALKDAAGRFNLYGDGSGNWAGINVNSAGTLTITGMSSQIWSSNIEVGSATSTAQPSWTLRRLNSDSLSDTQVIGYIQSSTGSYFAMNLYKSGTMKNQVVVREDGRMTVNGKYVPIIDTGTAAISAVAAGGAVTINVTFASGRFTATPVVSAISDSARHSIACTARSATGATFVINNWSGANAASGTLQWFALQE